MLQEAKIVFKYEPTSYEVLGSFLFEHESFERLSNGKGDFINRGLKKVNAITYKPDFRLDNYPVVIETKGKMSDSFPLRLKLFKKSLIEANDVCDYFLPHNQKECLEVIKTIKERYILEFVASCLICSFRALRIFSTNMIK